MLGVGGGTMERATEARAVADLLARAEIEPAGLVVEGEAGIGKTTLLLGAAAEAEGRGFRVLSAQGSPAEVTYAYAAVADLLRDVDIEMLAALPDLQRVSLERARIGEVDSGGPATDERMVAIALLSVIERFSTGLAIAGTVTLGGRKVRGGARIRPSSIGDGAGIGGSPRRGDHLFSRQRRGGDDL
jgi:hypothetical protein